MTDWVGLITIFCVGQCFFLTLIYLIKDSRKSLVSVLVMSLLLIFSYDAVHDYLVHSRLIFDYSFLVGWASLFTYLKGPILFFLTLALLIPGFRFRKIHMLHLLVFVYKFGENVLQELDRNTNWKQDFLVNYYGMIDQELVLSGSTSVSWADLWLIHPIVYLTLALHTLTKFRGNSNRALHTWISIFVLGYLVLYLSNISLYLLSSFFSGVAKYYWGYSSLQFCVLIIVIAFVNLSPRAFQPLIPRRKKNLTSEQSGSIIKSLDDHIFSNKTYLKKRLTVRALCDEMETSTHLVSQVINDQRKMNFQDYINEFRVKEAKSLIANDYISNYTLETLADKVGFNSNASFYRAFKKSTGTTPLQYSKSLGS
ncbi:MAG: AraC family transcriptional regulator [Cyclobacteriaceae bacterium]